MKPEEVFQKEFHGHKNFVTPSIIEYGTVITIGTKEVVYELSTGRGIGDVEIFGVTILVYDTATKTITRDIENSEGHFLLVGEAREHINKVRGVYQVVKKIAERE